MTQLYRPSRPLARQTRSQMLSRSLASGLICLLGCSNGPSRVQPPAISASGASSQALSDYDKDGDGFIAGSELDAAPGIKAAMATIDGDKDGKVTADEIAERIKAWQATRYGVMSVRCMFTMDGNPLDGASITFEPESFLDDALLTAVDVTSPGGICQPSVPKDQRPTPDTPAGFQLGLYRVRVSKQVDGKETIPARYNTETTLGQQISTDDPAVASQNVRFKLTSK